MFIRALSTSEKPDEVLGGLHKISMQKSVSFSIKTKSMIDRLTKLRRRFVCYNN